MASGDSLILLLPGGGETPSANFATFDVRNGHLILDFDDSTDESAELGTFMPRHYAGGGVTVTLGWAATTATSGDVVWNVAFKSISDDEDDLDSKAFATAQAATDTTASATGEVAYTTIAFTDGAQMDSVAVGEYFRLKVTRDANNASDTMVGDAELLFVEIKET